MPKTQNVSFVSFVPFVVDAFVVFPMLGFAFLGVTLCSPWLKDSHPVRRPLPYQ